MERAIQLRLLRCNLLTAYRALRTAEIERRERETLQRLTAKYAAGDAGAPTAPPIVITHAPAQPARQRKKEGGQASLF